MSNRGIALINVGFGNVVAAARVVSVVKAPSAPVKRLIDSAEKEGRLVDATTGKRTRSVLVTDSNHVVLSTLKPGAIAARLAGSETEEEGDGE
jgi:extracellular matrix regulatory protein A